MVEVNKMLRELRKSAKENNIPIMSDKGIEYLKIRLAKTLLIGIFTKPCTCDSNKYINNITREH